jgi:porin
MGDDSAMIPAMLRVAAAVVSVALSLAFPAGSRAGAEPVPVTVAQPAPDAPDLPAQQDEPGAPQTPDDGPADRDGIASFLCPRPASAHRLHSRCVAQPVDWAADTLVQDWRGFRSFLAGLGITPIASYTTQLMGNPSGGQTQGFTNAGALDVAIAWDLERLLGVPGLSFVVGASWSMGASLSAEDIGNVFTVQSAFSGTGAVGLQQMYLQEQLLDGALTLAAGRLAPANTFATLPVFASYLGSGVNPIPASLGLNDPAFAQSPPGVQWGAQAAFDVTAALEISLGLYDTNPLAAAGAKHGVDFALQEGNRGVLTVGQLAYHLNQAPGSTGLPGEYVLGGFYDSDRFSSLAVPGGTVGGNYAVYVMFQQMVYRDGGAGSARGLTVWGEVALSPRPSASLMPCLLAGGLSYQGLIPGRGSDIASLAVVSGVFSRYLPGASAETVIEGNYQVTLPYGISVTPDIQYVIKPGGSSRTRNALVIGAQLAVNF